MNAHVIAFPSIDWISEMDKFVSEGLGLEREIWTTQISNYDNLCALCDAVSRINVVLLDLCKGKSFSYFPTLLFLQILFYCHYFLE